VKVDGFCFMKILIRQMYCDCICKCNHKITGLFCQRALQKRLYSAKEACNFKEPTNFVYSVVIVCVHVRYTYGVATISRLLKIIGLFCKRAQ